MKFSEIEPEQWEELRPYLDTCLLPVTGLTGEESPFEATNKLEQLRDIMDLVEIPFHGRIVTYPAMHYVGSATSVAEMLQQICIHLKQIGFKFVVLITAQVKLVQPVEQADLWIMPNPDGSIPNEQYIAEQIRELWTK